MTLISCLHWHFLLCHVMFRRVGARINFLIKRFKGKIDKQDVEDEFYINSIKSFPKWLKRRNVISFLSIIENYFYIPNWWCFYIILRPEYSLLPRRLYIIPLLKYSLKKKIYIYYNVIKIESDIRLISSQKWIIIVYAM